MLIKIHFTPEEIKQYLAGMGFAVYTHTFGGWRPAYHNRDEWHEYDADAVVVDGTPTEAAVVFSNIVQNAVKQLVNGI